MMELAIKASTYTPINNTRLFINEEKYEIIDKRGKTNDC